MNCVRAEGPVTDRYWALGYPIGIWSSNTAGTGSTGVGRYALYGRIWEAKESIRSRGPWTLEIDWLGNGFSGGGLSLPYIRQFRNKLNGFIKIPKLNIL